MTPAPCGRGSLIVSCTGYCTLALLLFHDAPTVRAVSAYSTLSGSLVPLCLSAIHSVRYCLSRTILYCYFNLSLYIVCSYLFVPPCPVLLIPPCSMLPYYTVPTLSVSHSLYGPSTLSRTSYSTMPCRYSGLSLTGTLPCPFWPMPDANKHSRDRINFSRAMLKRFIRDCVHRDTAVYSPWLVKNSVALHYGLPTEMTPEIREGIARYRERQMDKRKREREERLGINNESEVAEEEEKPKGKKIKTEVVVVEEDLGPKKKPLKYPAEGTSMRCGVGLMVRSACGVFG